jgi:excisionase family DNA binding protein
MLGRRSDKTIWILRRLKDERSRLREAMAVINDVHAEETLALLKPAEVAAELGVSRAWLYEAAKTGRIPAIRIGGEEGPLRFVPQDLRRWIDDAREAWSPGRSAPATSSRPAGRVTDASRLSNIG